MLEGTANPMTAPKFSEIKTNGITLRIAEQGRWSPVRPHRSRFWLQEARLPKRSMT